MSFSPAWAATASTGTPRLAAISPYLSRRPAFTAFRTAATYLAGFRAGSWGRRDNVSVVVIDRGLRTTTVVWSRTSEGQTAEILARSTRALVVDVWGSARTIYAQDGRYVVELGGADCSQGCALGGPPLMLVEDAPAGSGAGPPPPAPTRQPTGGTGGDGGTEPAVTPTYTPTLRPTRTRYPKRTPTPTPTETPTPTPTGEPDLSASTKSATPSTVDYFEEVTFTITLRNNGSAAANVGLFDVPPLPYKAGSAVGGIWWDDAAGAIKWQGTLAIGEARAFMFTTYGPVPPVPHNTIYTNEVTIDDGVHPAFVRSVSVLANPEVTATPTAIVLALHLPLLVRP